jgi:deoxyguanosine kinase
MVLFLYNPRAMARRPARPGTKRRKKAPALKPAPAVGKLPAAALAIAAPPALRSPAFQLPRYIAVEGPIRVGKSSLARILAERMHARRINDCDEENPFLADFYREKAGSAFAAQMYFLNERYQRLHDALAAGQPGPVVADFIFEKDKIFAYLNLDNEELKLYDRYFARFATELPPPELVIYLQATPEVLRERVVKKAAPSESRISLEYIEEVVRAYEHFFFRYSSSNLLVVNTSEIDFVQRNADLQQLLQRLEEPVKGTQYFLPLGNV